MLGLVHYSASIRGSCVCVCVGAAVSPLTFALLRGEDLEAPGCYDFKPIQHKRFVAPDKKSLDSAALDFLLFGGLV